MNGRTAGRLIGTASAAVIGVVAGLALGRTRKVASKAAMVLHGDWMGQLKAEHAGVKKLLRAMVSAELGQSADRAALLEKLADALTRHAVEEENVIYPALRRIGEDVAVGDLFDDHARMKTMIRALQELSPEDPAWHGRAKALKKLIYRHIHDEERDLFPRLHDHMADAGRERLTKLVRREGAKVS